MTTHTEHAFNALLDSTWLSQQCGKPVRATALRVKPETSILSALRHCSDDTIAGWARLMWPDSQRKAHKTELWAQAHGFSVTTSPALDGLIFQHGQFEADPKLGPWLAPERLGFPLTGIDRILRYNPARRIVLRAGDSVLRVTVTPDERGFEVHRFVSKAVPTPDRLDDGSNPRLSIARVVGDSDLQASPNINATYQAGRILAQLHMSSAQLPETLQTQLAHRYAPITERMRAHERIFQVLAPDLAHRIAHIVARVPTHVPGPAVVVHGDASPDQFLISHNGNDVWLTDFDRIHLAPAAIDLGCYLSVVDADTASALLAGYADTCGHAPSQTDVRTAQLHALLLRIAEPMRSGDTAWRARTAATLTRVEELL